MEIACDQQNVHLAVADQLIKALTGDLELFLRNTGAIGGINSVYDYICCLTVTERCTVVIVCKRVKAQDMGVAL